MRPEKRSREVDAPLRTGSRRWTITFAVIAVLVSAFSLLALWGLSQSDWLYGTFGRIEPSHWERMADLRDRLAERELAPEAIRALDGALLLPHPSTETVVSDLKEAARALDPFNGDAAVREIQSELYALIAEIEPLSGPERTPWSTPTPLPSPTLTPIWDAPVAQG